MRLPLAAAAVGVLALLTGLGAQDARKAPAAPPAAPPAAAPDAAAKMKDKSFYTFKTTSLDGKPVDLSAYAGKVVLVVNVASKCGYTPQYKNLEATWRKYKDQGLVVIGFPSNDFGSQEPGTPDEIKQFCTRNYDVTFPLMAKVQTKAGTGQAEIYEYLGVRTGQLPGWNFGKYIVGRDGQPVAFYASGITPDGPEMTAAIEAALKPAGAATPAPGDKPASGAKPAPPAKSTGTAPAAPPATTPGAE